MQEPTLVELLTRVRLGKIRSLQDLPQNSPSRAEPGLAPGPFIESSVPNWAVRLFEVAPHPHLSGVRGVRLPTSGTRYLLSVQQAGSFQLRTLLPLSCSRSRELLEHASMHGTINAVYQIDGTSQAVEMWSALDRSIAAEAATESPVAELSEEALLEEAILIRSLAIPSSVNSLNAGEQVLDVLVIFCGEPPMEQIVGAGAQLSDDEVTTSQFH